jgi:membrane-bound lytic murein transglycosylase D
MATKSKILLYVGLGITCLMMLILLPAMNTMNSRMPVRAIVNPLYLEYSNNVRVQQWKHYIEVVQIKHPETKRSREFYLSPITAAFEKTKIPKERYEIYAEIPEVESLWRSSATSQRGAMGLWQIMPSTAKRFGFKAKDMYDPVRNTDCAVKYIAFLDSLYNGDIAGVLFAYNGGESGVNIRAKNYQTTNYWYIDFSSRETYNFAPKVIGAWLYNRQKIN